jgi:hypothetical protein
MRGVMFMLEAVIASMIILSFMAVIGIACNTKSYPDEMSSIAFNALEGLDNQGILRNYTEALNYTGIADEAQAGPYGKSVQLCDYAGSCVGSAPSSSNVWVGTYIVAGLSEYQPREVRLYIWKQ